MFTMIRSYEGEKKINTKDVLTALKYCCNYEGDLFKDGKLIFSCLGWDRELKEESIKDLGIESYIANGCYNYRYTDTSKRNNDLYATYYSYVWQGVKKLQINIHDYITDNEEYKIFKSIEDCIKDTKENHVNIYGADNISITSYLDSGCQTHNNKLFYDCSECYLGAVFAKKCSCKTCNSNKKTSKGICECQSRNGCYLDSKEV